MREIHKHEKHIFHIDIHYKDCTFSWKPERSVPSSVGMAATRVAAPGEFKSNIYNNDYKNCIFHIDINYTDCTFSWKPERSVPSSIRTAATSVAAPGEELKLNIYANLYENNIFHTLQRLYV